jgi:hypothetical protein
VRIRAVLECDEAHRRRRIADEKAALFHGTAAGVYRTEADAEEGG